MNHSTPGLPVHHQLPESTQTQVPTLQVDSLLSEPPGKHNVSVVELGGGAFRRGIDHEDQFRLVA